ncbi:MAG: RAMP superfamily CRISPR-associated protein, partial [Thermodesulfobacteriota bacterium]|nr:RAMP superfamily CRISPR-associated protein [Thermodesulfobacteriota bacterium]
MSEIKILEDLPKTKNLGNQSVFVLPLKIKVAEGSFLHIGATFSPLADKKQPVFSVDGQPVIPASSFKGVFRHQVEMIFIHEIDQLAGILGLLDEQSKYLLKPSIPAPRPSKAEKDLFSQGYRTEHSEIKVEEDRIEVPKKN